MSASILVLVVGPSGAGKDSVLQAAMARLPASVSIRMVQRDITRPADAGGEDHHEVSEAEFDRLEASQAYGLSWRAHGLGYGARKADLQGGERLIVLNASRSVIEHARLRYPLVRVLHVTAPRDVLTQRLVSRGRETQDDVKARLDRQAQTVQGADVAEVVNDRSLEEAADQVAAIFSAWAKAR